MVDGNVFSEGSLAESLSRAFDLRGVETGVSLRLPCVSEVVSIILVAMLFSVSTEIGTKVSESTGGRRPPTTFKQDCEPHIGQLLRGFGNSKRASQTWQR